MRAGATSQASPGDAAHRLPSSLACGLSSLLGVGFGFSLLITMVVTFVLVPLEHSQGHSVAGYFGLNDLIMHNRMVNVASWWGHSWPPEARETASDGSRLPSLHS